ncbi:MAG: SpoVG family protein [Clostridia bacterium]|nr:SpoVG family protein [Clostridia bacterium]
MKITDIKVRKLFDEGPMRAIISVTFDGQLAVHDIKVIYARDRYFIVMPSRKNMDGSFHDITHPINSTFRTMLEQEVLTAYEQARATFEESDGDAYAEGADTASAVAGGEDTPAFVEL